MQPQAKPTTGRKILKLKHTFISTTDADAEIARLQLDDVPAAREHVATLRRNLWHGRHQATIDDVPEHFQSHNRGIESALNRAKRLVEDLEDTIKLARVLNQSYEACDLTSDQDVRLAYRLLRQILLKQSWLSLNICWGPPEVERHQRQLETHGIVTFCIRAAKVLAQRNAYMKYLHQIAAQDGRDEIYSSTTDTALHAFIHHVWNMGMKPEYPERGGMLYVEKYGIGDEMNYAQAIDILFGEENLIVTLDNGSDMALRDFLTWKDFEWEDGSYYNDGSHASQETDSEGYSHRSSEDEPPRGRPMTPDNKQHARAAMFEHEQRLKIANARHEHTWLASGGKPLKEKGGYFVNPGDELDDHSWEG